MNFQALDHQSVNMEQNLDNIWTVQYWNIKELASSFPDTESRIYLTSSISCISDVGRSKYTWPPLQNAGGSKTSAAKPCNLSSLCIRLPGPPHPWLDLCTWQCSTARQPASNHLGKWPGTYCDWANWPGGAFLRHLLQVFIYTWLKCVRQ